MAFKEAQIEDTKGRSQNGLMIMAALSCRHRVAVYWTSPCMRQQIKDVVLKSHLQRLHASQDLNANMLAPVAAASKCTLKALQHTLIQLSTLCVKLFK